MAFTFPQKVLFKHCDPAGIVFYPRYFEMLNDAVEAFFDAALGWPFEVIHAEAAVPTASMQVQFTAPSRHGDALVFEVAVQAVGRSSVTLRTQARCGADLRMAVDHVLVHVDRDGRPQPWPARVRGAMEGVMDGPE
ncbi:putative 4-hydroxybenzoyl CoA thioesterase [Candidatus Rhodobacter oscarellae]|uniref:Putative 4-hydroxybenzoyl CoA thioesterase n=1 Tax=Candidatus Rhodobacter oscarellae TaxID=1675527 RepID=A0A0J9GXP6_9RHOB|nr:thioesterase family protein [Candidatus Rhodobacter lobularis]KMW58253.1 putative 4-hydroxybenzoyl CoA thioesterase [Candidatus Rhodobacter lobularis]